METAKFEEAGRCRSTSRRRSACSGQAARNEEGRQFGRGSEKNRETAVSGLVLRIDLGRKIKDAKRMLFPNRSLSADKTHIVRYLRAGSGEDGRDYSDETDGAARGMPLGRAEEGVARGGGLGTGSAEMSSWGFARSTEGCLGEPEWLQRRSPPQLGGGRLCLH